MNVLFICRHNRFRSKVGEALLRKLAPELHVKSAGVEKDLPYVAPLVKKIVKEYGSEVGNTPRLVEDKMIRWADKIIVVADNVDAKLFPKDKIEVWPIRDCDQDDEETIRLRVAEINKRVVDFIKRIKTRL